MTVWKARAGEPTFVDEGEDAVFGFADARLPRLRHKGELLVAELGEGADEVRRVDHHLLPLERGIEVRNDAHAPRIPDPKHFRRRPVLAAGAEGTRLEFL